METNHSLAFKISRSMKARQTIDSSKNLKYVGEKDILKFLERLVKPSGEVCNRFRLQK